MRILSSTKKLFCYVISPVGLKLMIRHSFFFSSGNDKTFRDQRRIQGEGWGGCNPPFGKFSNLSGYPCLSLFHAKNNIISYNVTSSPIDRYKKTVAIPLLDSLIIQMQGRFSDEHRHASHLLYVVPSIIVNKALQQDDEVEGMLFWEKDIPFLKSLGN